jgi:hypothetical protein
MTAKAPSQTLGLFVAPILGPLSMLVALFVGAKQGSYVDLCILYGMSALLFYFKPERALLYSLTLLSSVATLHLAFKERSLWQVGVYLSVALGLYLSYVGIGYAKEFLHQIKAQILLAEETEQKLKKQLKSMDLSTISQREASEKELTEAKDEVTSLHKKLQTLQELCDVMTQTMDLKLAFRDKCLKETAESLKRAEKAEKIASMKEKELARCQDSRQILQDYDNLKKDFSHLEIQNKASVHRVSLYQSLFRQLIDKLKETTFSDNSDHASSDLEQDYKHLQGSYKELAKQFDEKSKTLHATRKALFALETEKEEMEKEKTEDEINLSVSGVETFQEENDLLIDLVDHLMTQNNEKAVQEELF